MLQTIRYEAIGDIVKVAQYMTGYAKIKEASDFYGDAFAAYVMEWQAKNGLAADGVIGPSTWTKIAEVAPTCSTSKNSKSAYACAIQILLGGLTVDGIYGSNTKKAVAAYQSTNNLSADGICGPKTWRSIIVGQDNSNPSSNKVDNKQPIDYKQYDSRWGSIKYSTHTASQTIANSGCGPTSMADIVATWWDKSVTPKEMCELSTANGYRTYDSGTAWGFFEFCAKKYKAFKYIQTTSIATLQSALQEGAYAIVSFGPSKWTAGGHFCCIWKWDGQYFYINDPASASSSRAKGTESEVKAARKQFFIFYKEDPNKVVEQEPAQEPTKDNTTNNSDTKYTVKGSYIIDISKWQGNINFDVLKTCVSFVIARASCGSDKDSMFDTYAKEMIRCKIPFGVYCYSYAGTTDKAKDEAQKMVKYAKQYSPLFYVMDAEESKLTCDTISAFVKELRNQGIERAGCYVANHHYKDYKYDSIRDLYDFTWIPSYGKNDGTIAGSKKPSYKCDMWQYTSVASVPGISGNVDMNTITGDGKDLNWFFGGNSNNNDEQNDNNNNNVSNQFVHIINGNVNVRTQPNTSGQIIGVATNGSEFTYGGKTADNGWLSIIFNGEFGWVSNKYSELI